MTPMLRWTGLVLTLACALATAPAVARAQDTSQCIAASEQSLALRKAGKLHDAIQVLRTCASESCIADIRTVCQQRILETSNAMPSIIFAARDGKGNDLAAVKVTVDGSPFAEKLDGTALAIDPGAHDFTFETEGQPAVTQHLVIREGEKGRRDAVVVGSAADMQVDTSAGARSTRHLIGGVIAGVGLVGVGVGGALGLVANSKFITAKSETGPGRVADSGSAVSLGNVATVVMVAGGVLAVAGAVVWLTAPKDKIAVGMGLGGPIVAGAF
jgi:hypothetical protein